MILSGNVYQAQELGRVYHPAGSSHARHVNAILPLFVYSHRHAKRFELDGVNLILAVAFRQRSEPNNVAA